ncbi:VOC family protein [Pseudoprimorskyibacter insulae]|uniref:PhnB-like domain-containing protein n=1 Tax=Pseudoprimorskyibacter insulae TaxID=1695997 RepID=A0A2R8AYJ0_9RHOB|nr:VOC family protein [Pseudoprimorskyibacter insulae]SPF81096.1 hypothetical protein PRI8871_02913 [Pseudoprimorskyibacter insulae]
MATHPYLHFRGQCTEAMTYYASVFDGTDLQMLPYSQMPGGDAREGSDDRIMHAQMTIGDGVLMASDFAPGTEGDPQKAVSVMQVAPDGETAKRWFDRLEEGSDIIFPFGPTFFSPSFAMLRDKFGTHWIISAQA